MPDPTTTAAKLRAMLDVSAVIAAHSKQEAQA